MFLLGSLMGPGFMNPTKPPDPSFWEGNTGPDSGPSGDPQSFSDEPGLIISPLLRRRMGKRGRGKVPCQLLPQASLFVSMCLCEWNIKQPQPVNSLSTINCSEAKELSFDLYSHLTGPALSWEQFPILLAFCSPHFPPCWQQLVGSMPITASHHLPWESLSRALHCYPWDPHHSLLPITPDGHQKWAFSLAEDVRCSTLRQGHFFPVT